jgi:SAM-dependent methyltransferase
VILGDAMDLPLPAQSVVSAVSVWVVQSVPDPSRLFAEVARVLHPGGLYIVCTTQRSADDDVIGHIINGMSRAIDARRPGKRPRGVSVAQVLEWSAVAGFRGEVHPYERSFFSSPELELDAIERKSWPALRELDDADAAAATRPAIEALRALEPGSRERRGFVDVIVLESVARW